MITAVMIMIVILRMRVLKFGGCNLQSGGGGEVEGFAAAELS